MPTRRPGEWVNHGTVEERYSSHWVSLTLDEVERPDGSRLHHEVIRPRDAAGVVVMHPDRGILMIWRHRFMPDTWGWEIPGGAVDPGEDTRAAALRECHEETGWRVTGDVVVLNEHHPSQGIMNQKMSLFLATDAVHEGDPPDANEAASVRWRTLEEVRSDIRSGDLCDGFSLIGVLVAMAGLHSRRSP